MHFIGDGAIQGLWLILSLDPEVLEIAWLSLRVSALATLLAAVAGVPIGLAVALRRFPGRELCLVLFNTLLALPTVVVGLVFYGLLSYRGLLGEFELLYTPWAMIIAQAVLAFPLITALVISAARTLDQRVELTALTLGASRWQAARAVVMEARFSVMAALAAGFGRVITEVGAAIMVGGNIRHYTRSLTTAIALETAKGEFGMGMALGFILLFMALVVNFLVHRLHADAK